MHTKINFYNECIQIPFLFMVYLFENKFKFVKYYLLFKMHGYFKNKEDRSFFTNN